MKTFNLRRFRSWGKVLGRAKNNILRIKYGQTFHFKILDRATAQSVLTVDVTAVTHAIANFIHWSKLSLIKKLFY